MNSRRCYLAMPVTAYDTEQEAAASALLRAHGWDVVSPNGADHQAAYAVEGMVYFEALVRTCDALAFLRFPDGMVGAGVAKEIGAALEAGMLVMEVLPDGLDPVDEAPRHVLTVDETRARIRAIRERAAA